MTNNIERRFNQHLSGSASRYTRARGVQKMVYSEEVGTRADALKREAQIKKMSRTEKWELIKDVQ